MRILHVVPALHKSGGGPSESVPMTAMAQLRTGLEVAIAFYDVGELSLKAEEAERVGVKLIRFRGSRMRFNPVAFSWDLVRRFEDVAKDYDVIHTHVQWMFPIWWAAHVAKKLKKPLVMMPRGSFAPARLRESAWKKKLVGWLDRRAARYASAVWATSESEAEEIRAYVPGAKVEMFPIGLDVERFERGERFGKRGRTLLFLSRISPIKGLDLLAEAWSRIQSDWKLFIVGPDDRGYTEEIKKVFAAKCPAGSYEFRGPVYGDEKFKLLSSADAFVLPTRNENWGIAVAEAMASGLPVVCTKGAPWSCLEGSDPAGKGRVGGRNGRCGWWCDVSVEGLEGALRELMALSNAECVAMGANARRWVEENLDWAKIGARMKAAYERDLVLPILMTASVDTRGMKGADFSASAREAMYLETVRFYLAKTAARLVFAENSGWDLTSFAGKLAGSDLARVEFVALDPQNYDISRGKGWNEFKLITETIGSSRFIREAGGFLKVTGRYPIFNVNRFLRETSDAILTKGCVFYGDIKDHQLYKWLHLPWSGQMGQSVLFACTSAEWLSGVEPLRDGLDDAKGYWTEHLVYDYLTAARRAGKRVVCRFSRELRCGGLKGSCGTGAGYSKSNTSLKERLNRLIGNAVRIVAPWFWF